MVTATQSIRQILASQSSAAVVLQRFEIDLCSRSDDSLHEVCTELQLSVDQVLEKLSDAAVNEHGAVPAGLDSYSLSRLIQHIVRTHHQYVRRELPRLAEISHKLAGKHGDLAPELREIERILVRLHAEMSAHLQVEEQILFPFIAEMDQNSISGSTPHACFRTVAQPVSMMVMEHESAEGLVTEMRSLTNAFTPPSWACPTHAAFYAGLREFGADLRQHVHLENDLLFPRAIELEAELNRRG